MTESLYICTRVADLVAPYVPAVARPCTKCGARCWVSKRALTVGLPAPVICSQCAGKGVGLDIGDAAREAIREDRVRVDEKELVFFAIDDED